MTAPIIPNTPGPTLSYNTALNMAAIAIPQKARYRSVKCLLYQNLDPLLSNPCRDKRVKLILILPITANQDSESWFSRSH